MKAIVMAGGEGTRLRPITAGVPKPMTELFDRPILEHTVELLRRNGITDICFTLGYLPETVRSYFGDGEGFGVRIESRVEKTPLGTAGGVRACTDFIAGEDVLVISGDAVCDFDLAKCIEEYRKKKCDAALITYEHPSPTEYGLVVTEADGRVKCFIEKPDWGSVVTNRINTGIYILSPETVSSIPEGVPFDFGKDVFSRMLREGKALYGITAKGYWCDVGTPEAYRRCCQDILGGKTGVNMAAPSVKRGVWSLSPVPAGCEIIPPVYIGRNCHMGKGAVIGPETVLGGGTEVGAGAAVRRSVVNGAAVGDRAVITEATVMRGTFLGAGSEVCFGAVIGEKCVIGDGALIESGVKVWPGREIWSGTRVTESVTEASPLSAPTFGTDHILRLRIPVPLSGAAAVMLGTALAAHGSAAVAFTGGEAAGVIARAMACGVRSGGGECFLADCAFETECAFASAMYGFGAACFIRQRGSEALLSFFDGAGLTAGRDTERKIEAALTSGGGKAGAESFGGEHRIEGTARAYCAAAVRGVFPNEKALRSFRVSVAGDCAANRALREAIILAGGEVTERRSGQPYFQLSPDGRELYAEDEYGRSYDGGRLLTLAAALAFENGEKTVAAEQDAPSAIEEIGEKCGGKVLRVPRDGEKAREMLSRQRFMTDGLFTCLLICRAISERRITLCELMKEIPAFSTAERRIETPAGSAAVMRSLAASCGEMSAEISAGLTVSSPRGRVRVRPCSDGRALSVRAEAAEAETAEELCADIQRRLNKLL